MALVVQVQVFLEHHALVLQLRWRKSPNPPQKPWNRRKGNRLPNRRPLLHPVNHLLRREQDYSDLLLLLVPEEHGRGPQCLLNRNPIVFAFSFYLIISPYEEWFAKKVTAAAFLIATTSSGFGFDDLFCSCVIKRGQLTDVIRHFSVFSNGVDWLLANVSPCWHYCIICAVVIQRTF